MVNAISKVKEEGQFELVGVSREGVMWTIYGYQEVSTGRFWYVGATKKPAGRDRQHRNERWGSQVNFAKEVLQVRPADFAFIILASGIETKAEANYSENYFMVVKKTWHGFGSHGYNFHWSLSHERSKAGLRANRIAHQTPEFIAKVKARKQWPEARNLISIAAKKRLADPRNHPQFGTHLTEDHKRAISKVHKGKKISAEHIAAISRQDIPWDEVFRRYQGIDGPPQSFCELGREYNCAAETLRRRAIKAGIRLRTKSEASKLQWAA
jgi:hypothetical protein